MAPSSSVRPYNALVLGSFAVMAITGLYLLRISPVVDEFPVGMYPMIEAGVLPSGQPMKKHYTGLKPVDEILAILVTVFISGPAGWNEEFYWQQWYFLMQFAPIVAVMNVEACRERNRASWIKFTALWAFVYQNIGGAVIVPLWWLALYRWSNQKSYFASGRIVPVLYARLLLPGTILLYTIPTVAVYIPGLYIATLQNLLAFWQFAPVLASLPLWFASPFVSSTPTTTSGKANRGDLVHLKLTYAVTSIIGTLAHWITIYGTLSSVNPEITFSSVFWPTSRWNLTMDYGVLFFFQWDLIIIAAAVLFGALVAVSDVQRLLHGGTSITSLIAGVMAITMLTVAGGPGTALAVMWSWREDNLVLIEERSGSSSGKKKK